MNSFNKEQLLEDLKNWNTTLKKYQIPNTKKAVIQIANSFSFYLALLALQFYLFDKSVLFSIGLAIINGLILGRIFIIQHDCGHRSFTKNQTAIFGITQFLTILPGFFNFAIEKGFVDRFLFAGK